MVSKNSLKNLRPWQPGQSGNLAGKPIGRRSVVNILDKVCQGKAEQAKFRADFKKAIHDGDAVEFFCNVVLKALPQEILQAIEHRIVQTRINVGELSHPEQAPPATSEIESSSEPLAIEPSK